MLSIAQIGTVISSRTVPTDDDWDVETTVIRLADEFDESALWGLDTFSHIEVVYVFDRVAADTIEVGARRPRGNRTGRRSVSSPSAPGTVPTASGSPPAPC